MTAYTLTQSADELWIVADRINCWQSAPMPEAKARDYCDRLNRAAETAYTYPVSQHAEAFSAKMYGAESGKRYGEYIDRTLTEHVAKGHYTHEHALSLTLGALYHGNNGD